MEYLIAPLGAYLIGSISWGLIVGKVTRGVDVRSYGSGATGMTNVLRVLGLRLAILVMVADISKGVAAALLARAIVGTPMAEALAGILVIAGHNWPIFGRFRGGRGVTTGVGALAIMSPLAAAAAVAVFVIAVLLSRYVSLGSVLAVITAMIMVPLLIALDMAPWEYILYVVLGSPLILGRHMGNIQRLLTGTERRLGQREDLAQKPPSGEAQ